MICVLDLHIGYESIDPWPLQRIETPDEKSLSAGLSPKALLRADLKTGCIVVDSETQLTGIPIEAWNYELGNRSAVEWVLDQYKERNPRDETIKARFNDYKLSDYKEDLIALVGTVVAVSVRTVEIMNSMKAEASHNYR